MCVGRDISRQIFVTCGFQSARLNCKSYYVYETLNNDLGSEEKVFEYLNYLLL